MASVKDGLIIGGIILGAVILLPKFLQKQVVEKTFSLGAEVQRSTFEGKTLKEVLEAPSPIITIPNIINPKQPIQTPFHSTNQLGFFSPDGWSVAFQNLRDNLTLGGTIFQGKK